MRKKTIIASIFTILLLGAFGFCLIFATPYAVSMREYLYNGGFFIGTEIRSLYNYRWFLEILQRWTDTLLLAVKNTIFIADGNDGWMPMSCLQFPRLIKGTSFGLLCVALIVKMFWKKMPNWFFAIPFATLIITDLVISVWSLVELVGVHKETYRDYPVHTLLEFNFGLMAIREITISLLFLLMDVVLLALVLLKKLLKKIHILVILRPLPAILAVLITVVYLGFSGFIIQNPEVTAYLELFAYFLATCAYILLGKALLTDDEPIQEISPVLAEETPLESEEEQVLFPTVEKEEKAEKAE